MVIAFYSVRSTDVHGVMSDGTLRFDVLAGVDWEVHIDNEP